MDFTSVEAKWFVGLLFFGLLTLALMIPTDDS